MDYSLISGDSHIDLTWMPGDLFVENAPAQYRDLVPRVVEREDGPHWIANHVDLGVYGGLGFGFRKPQRGEYKRVDRMMDAGFYEQGPHPTTPALRLRDMDLDGIDGEVIYGILGIGRWISDLELTNVIYQAYNTWVADFVKQQPGRWAALACIPNHDPEAAAAELRRAAALGLKGADFAVATAVKPLWHRDWDALWQAAAECSMPISFHSTGINTRRADDPQTQIQYDLQWRLTWISLLQIAGAEYLASVIFSGACERFPDFKFVLGECGVTWLPHLLNRMDDEHAERSPVPGVPLPPSDYWFRQGYTTYQTEHGLADFLPMVGDEHVIWGSDYPHPDGIWPDSRETIAHDLAGVPEASRRKVTCDNAGHLYGFL